MLILGFNDTNEIKLIEDFVKNEIDNITNKHEE